MIAANLLIWVNLTAFLAVFLAVFTLWRPVKVWVLKQEIFIGRILQYKLMLDMKARSFTWFSVFCIASFAIVGYLAMAGLGGALAGGALGICLPVAIIKYLRISRRQRLDEQLVPTVESLASGVRAGLNLVQSMELVAKNMPEPVCQEFSHMLREYEYGNPLDEAMFAAADRIELPNYRLVFSALRTHRQRGGNLGETLDRIADSIREIHRLEKRVESLTAQNRSAARWMGAMPLIILAMLYNIDPHGVSQLFVDDVGRIILFVVALLNLAGFLWIRQLVNIDI